MKEPDLKNKIGELKPIFKSWNEVAQNVSMKYGANSLGEMAFWNDESWSFYLHDIYTTRHCRKLSWSRLPAISNTYSNLPVNSNKPESRVVMEQVGFQLVSDHPGGLP